MILALGVSGNHTAGSRKTSELCVLIQQPLLTAGGEQLRTDTDRRTALHHTGAVSAALCPTQKELPQGTMRFPFRFSFHLQNASPPQADSREEEASHRCLTLSPAPSTVSPLSAGRSRAPRHSPTALHTSTAPAPCKPGLGVLCSQQPGSPARFGDVTAALDLCGCAAVSQAQTQQRAAPSPHSERGIGCLTSLEQQICRGRCHSSNQRYHTLPRS